LQRIAAAAPTKEIRMTTPADVLKMLKDKEVKFVDLVSRIPRQGAARFGP
jgi:hypothetical protein